MKFTIISINDDRWLYKRAIRATAGMEEIEMEAFNANERDPLTGVEERGLVLSSAWPNPKRGELGVWLSNYDRWALASTLSEPLVVFEDDAIPNLNFKTRLEELLDELPADWDFAALWVPENQKVDYLYDLVYERGIPRINGRRAPEQSLFNFPGGKTSALVYQGYGMVSLVYSPVGGEKLVRLAHEYGITGPVDCWIYEQAHMNNLNGFAPKPNYADIVLYDWSANSHVQLTERVL